MGNAIDARPPRADRSRSRAALLTAIGLAVSAGALAIVARSVDLRAAADAIAHADMVFIAAGLAMWGVGLGIRAFRWSLVLPPVNGRRVPVRRVLQPLLVGYLGNAVLPARLGEPIRAYLIARREPVTFGGALGSVFLERVVDTSVLGMLAFLAALTVGSAPAWILSGTAVVAAVGAVVVAALATVGFGPLLPIARWPLRWFPAGVREPATATLERFVHWSGGSHRRSVVLAAAGLSLVAWLADGATMWLMGRAVGADLSPAAALLISTITVLSTAIPSAPGYVGTYELAAVAVATALSVPGGLALAMAVLAHVLAVVPSALAGATSLPAMGRGGLRAISTAAVEQAEAEGG